MRSVEWRHQYDADRDAYEGEATEIHTGAVSLVQRQFRKDSDINELVRRFGLIGRMPDPVVDPAYYGDVADIPDLKTALDRVRDASERFLALPAKVRSRFHNDPAELFAFLNDNENRAEAVKLGLVVEPAAEPPAPVVPPISSPGGGELPPVP